MPVLQLKNLELRKYPRAYGARMTKARIHLKFLTLTPTLFSTFYIDLLFLATVKVEDKVVVVVVVIVVKDLLKYKDIAPAIEEFIIQLFGERTEASQ